MLSQYNNINTIFYLCTTKKTHFCIHSHSSQKYVRHIPSSVLQVFCFNFFFLLALFLFLEFECERTCSHLYSICAVKWKKNYGERLCLVEWFIESLWRARFHFVSQFFPLLPSFLSMCILFFLLLLLVFS